jgi:hypothetical protein
MRTALMVLALLAAPAFAGQTVWKWVDENGVTHYSDQPIPGAERIEISTGSRLDSRPSSPSYSTSPGSNSQATAENYASIEILKPTNQESVVNTGGLVDVRVRHEPGLQPGHSLVITMDGTPVGGNQDFTLRDVPRGQHTLVAIIQDARRRNLKESAPVQFHVRQESIAQPPVGPGLRPQPKPGGQTANKPLTSQPSYSALNGSPAKIDPRTNKPVRP